MAEGGVKAGKVFQVESGGDWDPDAQELAWVILAGLRTLYGIPKKGQMLCASVKGDGKPRHGALTEVEGMDLAWVMTVADEEET